jgi:hypothetical protein
MAEFGENSLDALSVGSLEMGDDFLEAMNDDSANGHEVDYLLDELAREAETEPSTLESGASFSAALKESMAKFDEFLERSNSGSIHSSCHSRESGELDEWRELRPTSGSGALVGKRSRDHFQGPPRKMNSDVLPVSIRTISGDNLSSMPMHRSYATTSALNNQATCRADYLNPSQANQAWDDPEPILGEVTGSKMRRLVSQNSYFNSRPSTGTEGVKNASWALRTDAFGVDQRAATQMLLSGSSSGTKNAGFGASSSGTQKMGSLTKSRASLRNLTLSTVHESPKITPNASWAALKPAPRSFSIENMRRLSNAGNFPSHGVSSTSDNGAKDVASGAPKAAFAGVSLEEMQRLASTGPSFSSQAASATMASGTQNAISGEWRQAPKPAFGNMTMEEMIRLANTGTSLSSQAASATVLNATQKSISGVGWQGSNPAFGNVTMEDMLRLANSGASFPSQGQAWQTPNPASEPVSLEDMRRLANPNVSMSSQTPVLPSQAPTTPAFGSVTLEDMQRLANTRASSFPSQEASTFFPSQTATHGTQAAPQSATSNTSSWQPAQSSFADLTMVDFHRLSSAFASTNFPSQTTPIAEASGTQATTQSAASNTSSRQPAQSAFANLTMEDFQNLSSACASTNAAPLAKASVIQVAPKNATLNTSSLQTPKPAFENLTMEDFRRLAGASASTSFPTQTAQTTTESGTKAALQSASSNTSSLQTPEPSLRKLRMEEVQRLANLNVSSAPSAQAASTVSGNESQHASSNKAWKPSVRSVTVEEMQRRASADGPVASQSTPTALAKDTQGTSLDVSLTPVEKLEMSDSSVFSYQNPPTGSEHGNEPVFDEKPPPQKVSGGHLRCFMDNNSTTSQPSGLKNMAWPDPNSNKDLPSQKSDVPLDWDADALLKRLQETMKNSLNTQKALEEFDKERGLPRSHSQTMVNSSRSRKQLQEGKIIAKWDGTPLISQTTELGKPKPRASSKKSGPT